jgi:hypothetical protein
VDAGGLRRQVGQIQSESAIRAPIPEIADREVEVAIRTHRKRAIRALASDAGEIGDDDGGIDPDVGAGVIAHDGLDRRRLRIHEVDVVVGGEGRVEGHAEEPALLGRVDGAEHREGRGEHGAIDRDHHLARLQGDEEAPRCIGSPADARDIRQLAGGGHQLGIDQIAVQQDDGPRKRDGEQEGEDDAAAGASQIGAEDRHGGFSW